MRVVDRFFKKNVVTSRHSFSVQIEFSYHATHVSHWPSRHTQIEKERKLSHEATRSNQQKKRREMSCHPPDQPNAIASAGPEGAPCNVHKDKWKQHAPRHQSGQHVIKDKITRSTINDQHAAYNWKRNFFSRKKTQRNCGENSKWIKTNESQTNQSKVASKSETGEINKLDQQCAYLEATPSGGYNNLRVFQFAETSLRAPAAEGLLDQRCQILQASTTVVLQGQHLRKDKKLQPNVASKYLLVAKFQFNCCDFLDGQTSTISICCYSSHWKLQNETKYVKIP